MTGILRTTLMAAAAFGLAAPAAQAAEVNIYSYRQPELIQPLLDAFTEETGITANVAFLNKGMVERLLAEGKRSPADIILTTDISRLSEAVEASHRQTRDDMAAGLSDLQLALTRMLADRPVTARADTAVPVPPRPEPVRRSAPKPRPRPEPNPFSSP